ncbi:Phosphatidylinositol-4-phosphate 5-kinase [Agyrium rufum]|nr:Phosphatidylinositol-4-phosphate 5-kinase [Agyrium rufum]
MPSLLKGMFGETVVLETSNTSPTEPPHHVSQKKRPSLPSGITGSGVWQVREGSPVESSPPSKYANGSLIKGGETKERAGVDLTMGRSSMETYNMDVSESRNEGGQAMTQHTGDSSDGIRMSSLLSSAPSRPATIKNAGTSAPDSQSAQQSSSAKRTDADSDLRKRRPQMSSAQTTPTQPTRHRRTQSANTSPSEQTSPTVQRHDPSKSEGSRQPNTRYSSPPFHSAESTHSQSNSTTTPQHPGIARLQHRHTLQVPKGGGTAGRGSRDFSFSNNSEDAISSGVSPGTAVRRGSLGLARRTTRSMLSDFHLDDLAPDGDVDRWTENIKQKRASRKRRKEEEEDDRVIVGIKVDQNHVNWVTAYNMLTGIRFTVSRTNAKIDRELTSQDFDARHKFSFDITGNELTPSAKYDFKFKDYAPWVFRHLRSKFKLDPADYLVSLTSKYILSELGSPGKSGSFFYFSRDYKYIIKTIHHAEHKLLRKILREYYAHVVQNPNTLISQFYGLHRVKIPYGKKIHFVVMNNLFPPHRDIHQTFDLKGSTIGRDFKEDELAANPRATLKDLNWLRRNYHLEFGPQKKDLFVQQMSRDVALLQRLNIMDYSLLVGIHDVSKGNEENLRDKTLQVFQPGVERAEDQQQATNLLVRTPSKMETARKARELRHIIKKEKPIPMDQTIDKMPEHMLSHRNDFVFYSDDGGFRATHEDGRPGEEIYYLGIIDCLTTYGLVKKAEHFWKGMSNNKSQISPIPPYNYGERFVKFIKGITMPREEAERLTAEHEHRQGSAMDGSNEPIGGPSVGGDFGRTGDPSYSHLSRSSTDRVMEKAERQARKTEDQGANEEEQPDRTLSAARSPSAERTNGLAGATLPIVEEAVEGASTGGRSAQSREHDIHELEDGHPVEPQQQQHKPLPPLKLPNGGLSDEPNSPPLGGRPPPTPPKDSPLSRVKSRDKLLPSLPGLPALPRFTDSLCL